MNCRVIRDREAEGSNASPPTKSELRSQLVIDRRIIPAMVAYSNRVALLRVLRLAIAKRPVLLLHLHQADEGVLATKPHCFVESVGQCPIEG